MLLGFLIHSYVDCDYCLTHHYAHILSFALPPTYGLVCTVTTISLSALDAGFLLHPNRCTASHNLNHLVSPLSIVSAIEQLFHPALLTPLYHVNWCFFAFALPHISAIPDKVVLAYAGSLYMIVANGFSLFYGIYPSRRSICGRKKMVSLPVHRSSPALLYLSTCSITQ